MPFLNSEKTKPVKPRHRQPTHIYYQWHIFLLSACCVNLGRPDAYQALHCWQEARLCGTLRILIMILNRVQIRIEMLAFATKSRPRWNQIIISASTSAGTGMLEFKAGFKRFQSSSKAWHLNVAGNGLWDQQDPIRKPQMHNAFDVPPACGTPPCNCCSKAATNNTYYIWPPAQSRMLINFKCFTSSIALPDPGARSPLPHERWEPFRRSKCQYVGSHCTPAGQEGHVGPASREPWQTGGPEGMESSRSISEWHVSCFIGRLSSECPRTNAVLPLKLASGIPEAKSILKLDLTLWGS